MKPGGVPGGVFQTADGWMSILAINDRDWKSLCGAMEMPALASDPRFADPALRLANDVALYAIVRPAIASRSCAEWARRLTEARVMHERLNNYAEFLAQPHVREAGLIAWLEQAGVPQAVPVPAVPGTPPLVPDTPRAQAPVPGQHTRAILAEHGLAPHEIADLLAQGTVAETAP